MSEQKHAPEFSVAGCVPEPVAVEFADGVRQVPGAVVRELGGGEALKKMSAQLGRLTYADFMRAYGDDRAGRAVSAALNSMVGQHLRMFTR
ncbi:MAG TPA: hypothetical protein VF654_16975 [Pyrinomonadaceae bacterium]|jgi:hypothetical protein